MNAARTLELEHSYEGPFELVGRGPNGEDLFESAQRAVASPQDVEEKLEINTVRWAVDREGRITGSAQFIAPETYDFISAKLSGHTPEPEAGQDYRDAFVDVTFTGGTRRFQAARGEAKVEAKLYNDGMSRGTIRGVVALDAER
ncbi:MAG TPA: hypothetical protein VL988_06955 [Solirubrobacteraceae bacterium]|nr:hypothetical protein [Solirubrobacteraceae bacterium]